MRVSLTIAVVVLATTAHARPRDMTTLIGNAEKIGNNRPLTIQTIPSESKFSFATCVPPNCRCDVCGMVAETGSFAPVETRAYEFLGSTGCAHEGNTGLVVDVGANAGYFAAHALSMGCAVLALEPNPHVATLLQLNMALNRPKVCGRGWWHHCDSRIATQHALAQFLPVAVGAVNATASAAADNLDWGLTQFKVVDAASDSSSGIRMMPLSGLIPKDKRIMLLKIDTEGFEDKVFAGAMDVLAGGNVDNILVEVKEFNTPAKRELLRQVFYTGGFKYVYGYYEAYGSPLRDVPTLDGTMTDLTPIVMGDASTRNKTITWDDITHHHCEDHWFTKAPLPSSFMTPLGSPKSCIRQSS